MGTEKPYQAICAKTASPCGGEMLTTPTEVYERGGTIKIRAQKNADHFNATGPGWFSVRLLMGEKVVAGVEETATDTMTGARAPTEYYFQMGVESTWMPGVYQIQAQYHTANSQAPPDFFQCADIRIA